tara:strand:+ start:598 stop:816 length:219 start_codon:yes stop_codon:yes gene_type:complete
MGSTTDKNPVTYKEVIEYEVVDADDEFVRAGRIWGKFPDTKWVDVVDELIERAYAKECQESWGNGYGINHAP